MNPCEVTVHLQEKKKKKSENVKLKMCRRIQLNPNGHIVFYSAKKKKNDFWLLNLKRCTNVNIEIQHYQLII